MLAAVIKLDRRNMAQSVGQQVKLTAEHVNAATEVTERMLVFVSRSWSENYQDRHFTVRGDDHNRGGLSSSTDGANGP